MSNAFSVLVRKLGGKIPLGRLRRRWEDNIRMDLRKLDGKVWTGSVWLRIRNIGGLLWTR
jgi:hypothetical protein